MSAREPGEDDVASYLMAHPDFFAAHADLLASLTIPNAHGGRAVSLHERQLEVLRERTRGLEMRLAELIRIGQENDTLTDRFQAWTRQLLLTGGAERLPDAVADGLRESFAVPQATLRLWGVRAAYGGLPCAAPVDDDAVTLARSMKQPYCGPNAEFKAATWLPEGGSATRSIALLPLRTDAGAPAVGMLVLGSPDPARFQANMGTAFLERIADVAAASLACLVE